MIRVKVAKLDSRAQTPKYMSDGASGCDAMACLREPLEVKAGGRVAVPTGLVLEIPEGYEIQVRPRSGLSYKQGLTVVNAPGTIDSDYRGEVTILMVNLSHDTVTVKPGDRIAQLIINKVDRINWEEVENVQCLESSQRGGGGLGSTGVNSQPKQA